MKTKLYLNVLMALSLCLNGFFVAAQSQVSGTVTSQEDGLGIPGVKNEPEYILDERARKLAYGEQRRINLHRTGTLVERVRNYNDLNADDFKDHNALLPIPFSEIERNTDAPIQQNPGY